jgi:uncharacterized protein
VHATYAAGARLDGEASADLIQELLHQRMRQTGDRSQAVATARRVRSLCRLHDVQVADVGLALSLFETHDRLTARDAMLAAVALNRGVEIVLSADRDFDGVPGIRRIDPRDTAAVETLYADA